MALEDMEIERLSCRVTYWLMAATGTKDWMDPCSYTAPDGILEGELGTYKGVRIVEVLLCRGANKDCRCGPQS